MQTAPPAAPTPAPSRIVRRSTLFDGIGYPLLLRPGRRKIDRLDDVPREEELDRPIHHHTDPPLQARELHQVHKAPEDPREEPGESKAPDLRARGMVADHAEHPE